MSPWGSGAEPPTPEDRAAWARGEGVEPGEFRTLPAPPPVAPAQRPEPVCSCPPFRLVSGLEDPLCPVHARPVAAREEDPFCPQHGPARASDHAAAGCTCRPGDAREEQPRIEGVSSRPLSGAEVQAYHAAMASSGYFDPVRPSAPPAPSPDAAALVQALLREANTPLPITGEITRQLAPILTPLQGLMREAAEALAAQARRTEEAERDKYCVVETVVKQERELRALQQRLADAEQERDEALRVSAVARDVAHEYQRQAEEAERDAEFWKREAMRHQANWIERGHQLAELGGADREAP